MRIVVLHNAVSENDAPEDQDVLVQVGVVSQALRQLGHEPLAMPCTLDLAAMQANLLQARPDVVFNLVESLAGDDSLAHLVPAVLDALNLPYTGNPTAATFLSSDKLLAKERLAQAGLPTPAWIVAPPQSVGRSCTPPQSVGRSCTPPKDVQPTSGRSDSVGRLKVGPTTSWIIKGIWEQGSRNLDDEAIVTGVDEGALRASLRDRAARLRRPCYAEQFIPGREFNLAILDGPAGPQVLAPAEIDFSAFPPGKPRIVGYRAKWQADSFEYQNTPRRFEFPAAERPLLAQLRSLSLKCWDLFALRGYVRVDFRVDPSGRPWILEINTNPCLSPEAGFAAALQQTSIPFEQAIARILDRAGTLVTNVR